MIIVCESFLGVITIEFLILRRIPVVSLKLLICAFVAPIDPSVSLVILSCQMSLNRFFRARPFSFNFELETAVTSGARVSPHCDC